MSAPVCLSLCLPCSCRCMVDFFRIRVVLVGRGALHRGRCMYLVSKRQLEGPAWQQQSLP